MKSNERRARALGLGWCLLAGSALACSAAGGAGGSHVASGGSGNQAGLDLGVGAGASSGGSIIDGSGGTTITPVGSGGSETCASDSHEAMTVPIALYVLLDQSGSMTLDGDRWSPVTNALKAFLTGDSAAGLGVGLQYFPLGATTTSDDKICTANNYMTADVAVQDLPGNASALTASIDKHFFTSAQGNDAAHWGTPTYPALEGSYASLRTYLTANPSRRGVLLLATDGLPSKLCMGDTVDEVAALIASQAGQTPPIQTYVVGIGNVGNLNGWATAGGTGHAAFIVDGAGKTTETELTAALNDIRNLTLPCDYAIPTPESGTIDPGKVNVRFTPANLAPISFLNVANAAACSPGVQTWYYDDPVAPTHVTMCPAACDALHQPGAKIEVVFGCKTEVYIPK